MTFTDTRDTLFLAATRPAMKFGVPMEGYFLNLFGTFVFGMVAGSPLWWLTFFAWHMLMAGLANHNPHFFHELRMWWLTRGRTIGGILWAAAIHPARRPQEMATSV